MSLHGLMTLSADPFTWGHFDIMTQAASMCDCLTVAVLENPDKPQTVFKLEDRVEHVQRIVADFYVGRAKIEVISVIGSVLPTDLYLDLECDLLFRGCRDAADREYENQQADFHEMVCPGVKIILIDGDPKFKNVQSTTVRSFIANQLPVAPHFVPMYIQARMMRKVLKQKRLGILANDAVTSCIRSALLAEQYQVYVLQLGDLIADVPGDVPLLIPGTHDENPLFRSHMSRFFRAETRGKEGVILVTGVEQGWLPWVNNNVVVDTSPRKMDESFGSRMLEDARLIAQHDKYGQVLEYKDGDDLDALSHVVLDLVRERGAL